MKTKQYNVYKFDELSDDAQQHAFEKYRYFNVEDSFWYEYILDNWTEQLEKIGFYNAKIYFSGFSSQGDGAVFESGIDHEKLCNTLIMCAGKNNIQAFQCDKALKLLDGNLWDCQIQRTNSRYSHESACRLYLDRYDYSKNDDYWNKFFNSLEETLEDYRRDLCFAIYKDLETEYEYQTSDEQLRETFIINELEFTEEGDID